MAVRDRVGEYRKRMREHGFRPIQIWVPDVRSHGFDAEAHRQAAAVAAAGQHSDDQEFIEAVAASWDDE
ncbi:MULTISPECIES: antitoxin MazE family protein [Arthrobacter]|uniref:Antitoxin MazE family protein n=1 Tax=Arthrobacter methylotrophus TaxID=121291 RepID=A0ABV5ULC9_9MICC|nr:antitoxin MazE family protein [Arthrobacter sp. MA-N2]